MARYSGLSGQVSLSLTCVLSGREQRGDVHTVWCMDLRFGP